MNSVPSHQFVSIYRKEIDELVRGRGLLPAALVIVSLAAVAGFVRAQDYSHASSQAAAFLNRWHSAVAEQSFRDENVQVESSREPSPLEFLCVGAERVVPFVFVSTKEGLRWGAPRSSSNVADAEFGYLDTTFIVAVVLSLSGLLLAAESIARERMTGTLLMMVAFPVRRSTILIAKLAANWSILSCGASLAVLTCCLAAYGFGVPVWRPYAVFAFLIIALVYGLLFVSLGIFLSVVSRTTSAAVVSSVVAWTIIVLVLPRLVSVIEMTRYPAGSEDAVAFHGDIEISALKVKYAAAMRDAFRNYAGHYDDAEATARFYGIRLAETRKLEGERRRVLARVWREQDAITEQKRSFAELLNLVSPTSMVTQAASDLSGTGELQRAQYMQSARSYHERVGRRLAERREIYVAGVGAPTEALVMKGEVEPWMQPFRMSWTPFREAANELAVTVLVQMVWATAAAACAIYYFNAADVSHHQ